MEASQISQPGIQQCRVVVGAGLSIHGMAPKRVRTDLCKGRHILLCAGVAIKPIGNLILILCINLYLLPVHTGR